VTPAEAAHRTAGSQPHRLAGAVELLAVARGDPHVRAEVDPARLRSAWAYGGDAYGWVTASRRVAGHDHLTADGDPQAAAALLVALREHHGLRLGSVTLPRDADGFLPEGYTLQPRADWEWFVTESPPPPQPREDEVRWLDGAPDDELAGFLDRWSPRHDARPGRPGVLRWCGVRDRTGRLLATAAHTERVAGVPHLASIATSGERRGRGYGAAVTAWLTRALLREGTGWVTLGMYSDNDVARRIYRRLGYRCDHRFTSGALVVAADA
jgi:ribosomal protein S18 acetylase RimI-like enzyme